MKRRKVAAVMLLIMAGLSIFGYASGQQVTETKVDYASLQQGIVSFEGVITNMISGVFSASSLGMYQRPKGVYLDGYGLTFAFLINIHTAVITTPFGSIQRNNISPELKRKLIQELKEKLIRSLQDNSDLFQNLPSGNRVTIVAYIEDRNIPDEPNTNKTVVLSALKKDLDELGRKSDRLKEFRMRMKIVEY